MPLLFLLGACATEVAEAEPIGAVAVEAYIEDMWSERALTVQAGLEEARALYDEGEREAAQQMIDAVYQGSFEPELEQLVRHRLDSRRAAELEYGFGLLREAMGRRDPTVVDARMEALSDQIDNASEELDQLRAILG